MSSLNCFYLCVLFIMIVLAPKVCQEKLPVPTLSLNQRVDLLKFQVKQQIKEKQLHADLIPPLDEDDQYQYVEMDQGPITPINESDERKKDGKFMLRQIVSTSSATVSPQPMVSKPAKRMRKLKAAKYLAPPIDTFYRRLITEDMMEQPIVWLHCQDLFTPFISGHKTDFKKIKLLSPNDRTVIRFMQLLRLNTTGHTREEIYSILYQMSNIQLRLFHWDMYAIKNLVVALVKDKAHTFRNIIKGVKDLLKSWHLDLSNTTNLLKQAKIFRPPCVRTSEYGGSTKTPRGLGYSKLPSTKTTCSPRPGNECNLDTSE